MAATTAEAELTQVLCNLEGCVQGDADASTRVAALKALTALVDPTDESYEVQRAAADRLLPAVLMQLLEDDDAEVAVEAANALAALSEHAGVVTDRVEAGHFAATPEKVSLNPVQEAVGELEGIFGVLVNMRFSDNETVATAGTEALAALTALNRSNTLALIHEVVKRLGQGEARALGALEDLIVGFDVKDDAAVLLDQALSPALGFLRTGSPEDKAAAASLLGAITEGRRGAASFLVAEGALPIAAGLLTEGDLPARDAAALLVWTLVKDDRKLLAPEKGALGVAGPKLIEPLLEIVEKSEEHAEGGEGEEEAEAEEVAVDNGDAALLLLRALASQDEVVAAKLQGSEGLLATRRCTIM